MLLELVSLLIVVLTALALYFAAKKTRYTAIDYTVLGLVGVVFGVVFVPWWTAYYVVKAVGGPVVARLLTYGLWFMAAPMAAVLIRKPLSAFLGETIAALIESLIPTAGGLTNLVYGFAQGLASEVAYAAGAYRSYGLVASSLAGGLAAFPAVALDAVLFGDIYPWHYMVWIVLGAFVSGLMYGAIAYLVGRVVRP
ncbi:ABC transporter subunit [Thermogladius calderae 1633]|uniref:ABC transporter subunit n=1 Tax=Thermogladius calderae (strain DSM 22663 / VKM B-2946 / 1633) TaxID=1184251 RepID=I3TF37_THEC1|nr:ECF transporter S component [Thermogladius calderae]AFK51375.1 ABC transporter subunit [Thermogladius calderae 1633]